MDKAQPLSSLYDLHSGKVTDKWSSYLDTYEQVFAPLRTKPINMLEIGVQNGGSLEIWARYFKKAKRIVGCDIDEKCRSLAYSDSRISVVVGDANSLETEQAIARFARKFNIIIDDGSHRSGDVLSSFVRYFPYLPNDGIYIIEDMHCSYWPSYEGGLLSYTSALEFFKLVVDIVNEEHWNLGVEATKM